MRRMIMAWVFFAGVIHPEGDVMAQVADGTGAVTNRQIVVERFEAWRQGTGSPFEILTPDVTWTIAGRSTVAGTYEGREAFMQAVIRPFNARLREPLRPDVRRIHADGSTVVVRFDAVAVANDGIPYRNTYAWFLEMRDGHVIEVTAFFDSIAFDEFWARVAPN